MARRRIISTGNDVEFNMTPMIDCTFQLIIFFILASSVITPALAPMELHRPDSSQATEEKDRDEQQNRVIVNILSIVPEGKKGASALLSAQCGGYKILSKTIEPGDTEQLERELKRFKKIALDKGVMERDFIVEIRGDQRVSYEAVKPVMKAAAKVQIERMNITALIDKE